MAYERIDWENEPSVNTPINEDNLNHMEDGIVQNETDIAGKMDANNPTGTGAVSINRLSGSVVGSKSVAMGNDCSATQANGVAMGSRATASGVSAIAMGQASVARANYSHSFGRISVAEGEDSVVFGYATNAKSDNQFVEGKYNEVDTDGTYAHITGGGTGEEDRRNIQTLDWEGNEHIAGDYTNGNDDKLSNKADGSLTMTAIGNPVTVDAYPVKAKSVKVNLLPIQSGSGDPSPTNVRAISGRSSLDLNKCGKNLVFKTINGCNINSSGYLESNAPYAMQVARLEGGVTYTLTGDENRFVAGYFSSEPSLGSTAIGDTRIIQSNMTITAPYDCWIAFRTYNDFTTPQLEVGSTATDYEPYNGETKTIPLGSTVYGGVLDVTGGELTINKICVTFDENTTWIGPYFTGQYRTTLSTPYKTPDNLTTKPNFMCSQYDIGLPSYTNSRPLNSGQISCFGDFTQNYIVFVCNNDCTTVTDITTAMNGVQLCYELATPTTVSLTPTDIEMLLGTNNISTDDGNATIELTYVPTIPEVPTTDGTYSLTATVSGGALSFEWVASGNRNINTDTRSIVEEPSADDEPAEEDMR